jgi:hypothetical protein
VNRYLPTYRRAEMELIAHCARSGQSLCFVGVAGSGKSNITNFLRHDPYGYKLDLLGADTSRILFPRIDGNSWQRTPQSLWSLLLADAEKLAEPFAAPAPDPKVLVISDEPRLTTLVEWLCQKKGQQVMFILDDFDSVLETGPPNMLDRLYAMRNAGNQDRLSYLIFTKKLPHILGRAHPLAGKSKFYDLFKSHIYALKPYNDDDARHMLDYLNEKEGRPLNGSVLANIQHLAGSHGSLLKTLFDMWRRDRPSLNESAQVFAALPDVRAECLRILQNLHDQEQEVALRLVRGQAQPGDQETIDHLARRGLVKSAPLRDWFSPVMAEFMRQPGTA